MRLLLQRKKLKGTQVQRRRLIRKTLIKVKDMMTKDLLSLTATVKTTI
jgi:hypothetical protein